MRKFLIPLAIVAAMVAVPVLAVPSLAIGDVTETADAGGLAVGACGALPAAAGPLDLNAIPVKSVSGHLSVTGVGGDDDGCGGDDESEGSEGSGDSGEGAEGFGDD